MVPCAESKDSRRDFSDLNQLATPLILQIKKGLVNFFFLEKRVFGGSHNYPALNSGSPRKSSHPRKSE